MVYTLSSSDIASIVRNGIKDTEYLIDASDFNIIELFAEKLCNYRPKPKASDSIRRIQMEYSGSLSKRYTEINDFGLALITTYFYKLFRSLNCNSVKLRDSSQLESEVLDYIVDNLMELFGKSKISQLDLPAYAMICTETSLGELIEYPKGLEPLTQIPKDRVAYKYWNRAIESSKAAMDDKQYPTVLESMRNLEKTGLVVSEPSENSTIRWSLPQDNYLILKMDSLVVRRDDT